MKARIAQLRRLNAKIDDARTVAVPVLSMTRGAMFEIDLLAREDGSLCWRDRILLRCAGRGRDPLFRDRICVGPAITPGGGRSKHTNNGG